jgi:GYF domain 2/Domain of unknown function (DUF4190)
MMLPVQYYFAVGTEQRGPVSLEELAGYGLRPDTLVWREGLSEWVRAEALPELTALLPIAQPAPPQTEPQPAPAPLPPVPIAPVACETPLPNPSASGMAIASLVLGISSLPTLCVFYLGIPCAILAIVFGIIARGKAKRGQGGGAGMALAGIILGCSAIGLVVLFIVGIILFAVLSK